MIYARQRRLSVSDFSYMALSMTRTKVVIRMVLCRHYNFIIAFSPVTEKVWESDFTDASDVEEEEPKATLKEEKTSPGKQTKKSTPGVTSKVPPGNKVSLLLPFIDPVLW